MCGGIRKLTKCAAAIQLHDRNMPKRKRKQAARLGWKKRRGERDASKRPKLSCSQPTQRKRRKLWDNESMINAMEAVKSGNMRVNEAAREHGVPCTTLKDRLSGRVKHGKKSGPMPYLTSQEEDELATFLTEASNIGYGKTKREIILIVQKVLEQKVVSLTILMEKGGIFASCKDTPGCPCGLLILCLMYERLLLAKKI